ncbi:MAG: hypothetical protein K0Q59_469 [Paenibacillus sp.]|nr:hypothetical protein [Paenibacillus sp.]
MAEANIGSHASQDHHGEGAAAIHPAMRLFEPFVKERAIDLTAFIGQWPSRLQIRADAASLSAMADRWELSAMCVSHIASIFGFDTRSGNEELFRETAGDARLLPFPIIDPSEFGWEHELAWAAAKGARGIRLVPGYHGYSLMSPQVASLIDRVRELSLPLHVCVRLEDERLTHPRFPAAVVPFDEIGECLRLCEDMPVIISGLRAREWGSVYEVLNAGHRTDRVLLDLWFTNGPIEAIASVCRSGMASRLGYGSNTPIQVAEATSLQLASAAITAEERSALCRGNAAALLGLE